MEKTMGRKRKFSKLLLFTAMLSTIGAGVLGSVPLPVKAAETEETYTVTFEAYEGNCETESRFRAKRGKHHPAGCVL